MPGQQVAHLVGLHQTDTEGAIALPTARVGLQEWTGAEGGIILKCAAQQESALAVSQPPPACHPPPCTGFLRSRHTAWPHRRPGLQWSGRQSPNRHRRQTGAGQPHGRTRQWPPGLLLLLQGVTGWRSEDERADIRMMAQSTLLLNIKASLVWARHAPSAASNSWSRRVWVEPISVSTSCWHCWHDSSLPVAHMPRSLQTCVQQG